MTPHQSPTAAVLSRLRPLARRLRKRGKRIRSHLTLGYLKLRNAATSGSVLGSTPVVVSLTSYGSRIPASAMAVESIARGTARPSRLILWLDDPAAFADLPRALRRLQRRGLEVRLTENLGPHTKYYPYVESVSRHNVPLVTADDDIMYPRTWLADLYAAHLRHPDNVNCHWASEIVADGGRPAHYIQWPNCRNTEAKFSHFGLGVSGVIYPPQMLSELAARGRKFKEMSPSADDVWLHWVALQAGIPVRQISNVPRHFPLIPGTQEQTLMSTNNVEGSGNDAWISGLYTDRDVAALGALSGFAAAVEPQESVQR